MRAEGMPVGWTTRPVSSIGEVRLEAALARQHARSPTGPVPSVCQRPRWRRGLFRRENDAVHAERATGLLPAPWRCAPTKARAFSSRTSRAGPRPGRHAAFSELARRRLAEGFDARYAAATFKRWLDLGLFMRVARQTTSMAHLGADRFARMPFSAATRRAATHRRDPRHARRGHPQDRAGHRQAPAGEAGVAQRPPTPWHHEHGELRPPHDEAPGLYRQCSLGSDAQGMDSRPSRPGAAEHRIGEESRFGGHPREVRSNWCVESECGPARRLLTD